MAKKELIIGRHGMSVLIARFLKVMTDWVQVL